MERTFVGAIAVLDVLGFTSRGATLPAAEARRRLLDPLIYSVFEAELVLGKDLSRSDIPARFQYMYFADTAAIVLPTLARGELSVPSLVIENLARLCAIVVTKCIWNGVPIRGAISYGEVLFSDAPAFLLGAPAFEAHHEERLQEWAGVVLCHSADRLIAEAKSEHCCRWSVHMKAGVRESRMVVNWPRYSPGPSMKRLGPNGEAVNGASPDWNACFGTNHPPTVSMMENTKEFFDHQDATSGKAYAPSGIDKPISVDDLERIAKYRRPPIRADDDRL